MDSGRKVKLEQSIAAVRHFRHILETIIGCATSSILDTSPLQAAKCQSRWRILSPLRMLCWRIQLGSYGLPFCCMRGRILWTTVTILWKLQSNTRRLLTLVEFSSFARGRKETLLKNVIGMFQEFFLNVKDALRSTPASGPGAFQKWGNEELQLNTK